VEVIPVDKQAKLMDVIEKEANEQKRNVVTIKNFLIKLKERRALMKKRKQSNSLR